MEKEIFDKYGDIKIESIGLRLKISPVNQPDYAGCSSCGGCG
ncbi:hypothetical protein SH2C18_50170 [Clostridium sediminicola]